MTWPIYRIPACMGGFKCAVRDSCRNYHAEDRRDPSERLCSRDARDLFEPVVSVAQQAAEQRELTLMRTAA